MKQRVGYLPENPYFYDYLTGWEFLMAGDYSKSQLLCSANAFPSY